MTGIIDIKDVVEHEDGSATVVFNCDIKTREMLIGHGLLSLVEKAVSKEHSDYSWITEKDNE